MTQGPQCSPKKNGNISDQINFMLSNTKNLDNEVENTLFIKRSSKFLYTFFSFKITNPFCCFGFKKTIFTIIPM